MRFCARYLLVSIASVLLTLGSVKAQNNSCDEGVIRLPDRSGTIQICSTLAAKVPHLSRQLGDLVKAYSDQRQQIAELTRLVRGLNNVGRALDVEKQARMLESLSINLSKTQSIDTQASVAALDALTSRIDELQSRMLSAMSSTAGSSALTDALKGALGEAIAKLDLGSANEQLAGIAERIQAVQTGISDIKSDTVEIRQQIAQLDKRQRDADNARDKRDQASIDILRQLAGEVREHSQRGGLIDNPTGYSSHYHNARVFTQRGEVDLALNSYRQLFRSGVQMADPIVDLATLLIRRYGRQAALRAISQEFRKELPEQSYLYAIQLLADKELDEVEKVLFAQPMSVAQFPPLAAIYLQKLQERLTRTRAGGAINIFSSAWVDLAALSKVVDELEREIDSGNFLAFYIDHIRGGRDLDEVRKLSEAFRGQKLLRVRVPRLSAREELSTQSVNLSRSPIVLDYTYFFEPPSSRTISDLTRESASAPRYKNGSLFLYVWDAAVDTNKPIQICSSNGKSQLCKDINTQKSRCSDRTGSRAINCLLTREASNRSMLPTIEAHLVLEDILSERCISRVIYTNTHGLEVVINRTQLIGAFRRKSDPEIEEILESCGYDNQKGKSVDSSLESNNTTIQRAVTFAKAVQPEREMPYIHSTCEAIGEPARVYGSRSLASHMLDLFLIKVSHKTNSFPIVPSILRTTDGSIGRFDNSDGKCKIDLLINAKRQTCIVEKLVKSRWLPADLAEIKSKVPAHTIAWNGGIYPDAGSGIQCTVGPDELNDSMKSRTIRSMNTRTVERIELLELSSIEDELVTLGAGHSSSCDTIGYTGMKFRVSIELGFRAIEKNTCGLGSIVRKTKFLEGKQAVTDKIFGCFTEKDFERYVMRANEWLDAAETDCKGIAGRKVRELANDAVEWVVDQS